jgi:hypothetical protein
LLFFISGTVVILLWPAARESALRYGVTAPLGLVWLFIVVNAVFKEMVVTSYVMTSMASRGAAVAIMASTLVRVAYHVYQGPLVWLSMIPLGFVFGSIFWRGRNAWPLIVGHAIANCVAFAVDPNTGGS